ncbi:hypothetical protein [Rugosimonospora acidiphila]
MMDWHYSPYLGLYGGLQRGHGTAAARLRDRPEHASLVYACIGRDTRWDRQVDDRYTYLARLLRDLRLDPAPVVAQLRACAAPPGPDDDDNRFELAAGVLTALAGTGDLQAREALRDYIRDGTRWIETLEGLCDEWPVDWWDDLWETAAARIDAEHAPQLWPHSQPWQRWYGRDRRLDTVLDAAGRDRPRARTRRTDLAAASDDELVGHLLAPGAGRGSIAAVLRHIRCRGHPVPQLLDVAERLALARPPGLLGALGAQGRLVVPLARAWASDPDHPLFLDAPHLLAQHGDVQDIPVLLAALDRLADRWCGHDTLTEGLARILADAPDSAHAHTRARLVRQLRGLLIASPHSYERASHLRSLLLLDATRTTRVLPFFLLDCEPTVRLLAAQHTPLTDQSRYWIIQLRDDPIEDDEVRHTAAQRLA